MSESAQPLSFRLFGYPLAHSAAPALHNVVFEGLGGGKEYSIFLTSKVTQDVLDEVRRDECGGCAVTMPIKTAIIPYLDELTSEAASTGAVNTIVKVRSSSSSASHKLVGTNTDILGVKNALLRALWFQHPSWSILPQAQYSPKVNAAAVVIGGGATTRSAVHALWTMGIRNIYLVNRLAEEVELVRAALPHVSPLIHLTHADQVEALLGPSDSSTPKPHVLMVVGAIPAHAPITPAERMVYTTISHILTIPHDRDRILHDLGYDDGGLPVPTRRLFLEMPYKPRVTPLLQIATALGWHSIPGVEAMIEQGLAQQRMWLRGDASAVIGSDASVLGDDVEMRARKWVANMQDIIVTEDEIDRAEGKESAPLPLDKVAAPL